MYVLSSWKSTDAITGQELLVLKQWWRKQSCQQIKSNDFVYKATVCVTLPALPVTCQALYENRVGKPWLAGQFQLTACFCAKNHQFNGLENIKRRFHIM